ncbi:MAG: response regulator [Kosmotoga sp.]|uniref:response regulator n=1 Tax=Kosmotoga sp. TaxID=1955248 RepID=UPI0025B7E4CB|nr:response regulator [Kosmotoga sp.]MCD6159158.1 response regulator [Kosmotoga sp.]
MGRLSRKVSLQFFLFVVLVLIFIGVFTFLSFVRASKEEYTSYLEAKKQDVYSWFIEYKKSLRDNLEFFLENGRLLPEVKLLVEYKPDNIAVFKDEVNLSESYENLLSEFGNTFYAFHGELLYFYQVDYSGRKFLLASKVDKSLIDALSSSLGKDTLVFLYKDGLYIVPEDFKELEIYPTVVKNLYDDSSERPVNYVAVRSWLDQLLFGSKYLVDRVELVGANVYILQSEKLLSIFQKRFAYLMLAVTMFVLLFSFTFSATLNSYISRALKNIIEGFESIKQGKFEKVKIKSRDELQLIAQELNKTMEFIKDTLEKLKLSNEQLKEASIIAQQANKMKSEFLANMSHEMRTPMNAVLGFTELLMAEEDNPEKRKYLSTIYKSGEHLLNLINDVLDLSKIESGKLETFKVPYSPRELLKNLVETYIPLASSKELHLAYNIDEAIPEYLLGDELRIRQILTNLISNAIKFTETGYVTIRAINGETTIDYIVKDTGIGISEKDFKKIFEPFTQLDGTMSRKYGGTGLGLTITKRLVELLEGELFIKSSPGKGTEITIRLKKEIPSVVSNIPTESDKSSSLMLLLITQDTELLENLGSTFSRHGMKYRYTDDLDLAKLLLNNQEFSFVLLDGDSYVGELKGFLEKLKIPFLILSERRDIDQIFGEFTVAKPISEDRLINKIYSTIQKAEKFVPKKAKILIVEDNEANRLLFKKMLEKMGHEVKVVENGKIAVEIMSKEKFDMVFMDMQMPIMDGYTATRKLRKKGIETPIIALTAHTLRGDEEKALIAGCDGYLGKPVKRKDLLDAVRKFLDLKKTEEISNEENPDIEDASSAFNGRVEVFAKKMGLSMEEALTMFKEYGKFIEERIEFIQKKIKEEDFESLAIEGHSLKGSGSMYSVEEVSKLGLSIEKSAKEQRIDELHSQLKALIKLKRKIWG